MVFFFTENTEPRTLLYRAIMRRFYDKFFFLLFTHRLVPRSTVIIIVHYVARAVNH